MKKNICILLLALCAYNVSFSQVIMEDDFESNQYNWSELAGDKGTALIKDGVLHLESPWNGGGTIFSTCYAPFDINKPFILSVEALAKKVSSSKTFGILLDYEDNQNYILFSTSDDEAVLEIWKENRLVGYKIESVKLPKGKKVGLEFEVEYNLNELIFKVNGIRAMSYRRRISKDDFLLGTSGIGFLVKRGAVIDFDNLKVVQ